ncbi:MAG: NADH-quinone oxidoreductase subunit NuoN [Burkholderiales bacterium]|jgi:NADH-quinone oxidoreductase subunit N|nr:NADH-quinone oxidoreductase subunit NuoN [Nitrosomonadaceae bacterium]
MKLPELNMMLALPEMVLMGGIVLIMLYDLFSSNKDRVNMLMLSAIALLLIVANLAITAGSDVPMFAFSGMFVADKMAAVLKVALLLSVAILLVYSRDYMVARKLFTGEFVLLLLFATLGMMIMVSANHFVTLYLGLEILALSTYAMVALNRDSAISTEAAMKYFVLGALASGLLLYGMSMIYGATGSLDVAAIARMIEFSRANDPLVVFGLVFIVSGLAFKLGAVPFHMWVPDVYQGAPTPMTLFIGSASKIAAFGFLVRILGDALSGASADWSGMLIILAVASLAVGNIIAIAQTNIKRMLAYSTISHMGFLLLGILAGTKNGYAASMFYIITYAIMSLGAFGIIMLLSRPGFEADTLDDLRGLNQRSPWVAFLMLVMMMSMAGIPPFVGFFAKLSVLEAVLQAGYTWLVVYAVLMSVIGAFYYLRILKLMYMDEPTDATLVVQSGVMRTVLGVNGFVVILLGLVPGAGLMGVCLAAVQRSL